MKLKLKAGSTTMEYGVRKSKQQAVLGVKEGEDDLGGRNICEIGKRKKAERRVCC